MSDTELNATLTLKVGPVKARFKGNVKLVDLIPPEQYTIIGEGQGGVAGFGKMKATVTLLEVDGGTRLNYVADAQVGGKLAQVGSRLIEGTATKLAQEFFDAFEKNVVAAGGADAGDETLASAPAPAPAAEAPETPVPPAAAHQDPIGAVPKWVWAVGAVAALVIVMFLTNMRG